MIPRVAERRRAARQLCRARHHLLREWANRRRAESDGIPLPPDVMEKLAEVARETGVALPGSAAPLTGSGEAF